MRYFMKLALVSGAFVGIVVLIGWLIGEPPTWGEATGFFLIGLAGLYLEDGYTHTRLRAEERRFRR